MWLDCSLPPGVQATAVVDLGGPRGAHPLGPVKISHNKMATKGVRIDFMFLGPSVTRPLDLLLIRLTPTTWGPIPGRVCKWVVSFQLKGLLINICLFLLLNLEIKTGYDVLVEDENCGYLTPDGNCGYLKPTIQDIGKSKQWNYRLNLTKKM